VEQASTVSQPHEIKDGDIIQLGRDYKPGVSTAMLLSDFSHAVQLDSDTKHKSSFKCIKAKVYIEPCDTETLKLTAGLSLNPPAVGDASINFEYVPCSWTLILGNESHPVASPTALAPGALCFTRRRSIQFTWPYQTRKRFCLPLRLGYFLKWVQMMSGRAGKKTTLSC
jgi:hypothetical protein